MAQVVAVRNAVTPDARRQSAVASGIPAMSSSVRMVGLWSAVAMVATYVVFLASGVAILIFHALSAPWDTYIPYGASILIAPSFVILIISVHYATPEDKRIWSHVATAFATLYAAFVSIVYVTWLFVVEPHMLAHTETQVSLLANPMGSFMELIDGLGYTYMGLSVCLTALAFAGGRLPRWIRGIALANGPAALLILASYVFQSIVLGVPGTLLVVVYGVLLAIYFFRSPTKSAPVTEVTRA